MSSERRAEIVGGGFAGLAAAAALAQRGWRVRLHERADALRTEGAGIYIYENGLRVLEALGACEQAIAGAHIAATRETHDDHDRILAVHRWDTTASRVYSIVRQRVIDALAAAARRAGAEIVTGSAGVGATPQGELLLSDGSRVTADLIVAADGVNSRLRDALGLLRKRKQLPDGAIRLLIDKTEAERAAGGDGRTVEYWSGTRRIVFTPCSDTDIYIALTMLNADEAATRVPVDQAAWACSFPHLADLIARFGTQGHYAPFEWITLKRWSAGRVAVI